MKNRSVRSNLWFSVFLFVGGVFVYVLGFAITAAQADSLADALSPRIHVPSKVLLGHLVEVLRWGSSLRSLLMSGPWFLLSVVFAVRGVMEYLESDEEVDDVIE